MTQFDRCQWCGEELAVGGRVGRPRQYCRQSCRQQAHMARKLADAHRLAPDETVVRRGDLTELQDRLYGLQAALEDVANDLADSNDPEDVRQALAHLVRHARPVADLWITPVADRTANST